MKSFYQSMRVNARYLILTAALVALVACAGPSNSPSSGPTPLAPGIQPSPPAAAPEPPAASLPGPDITLSGTILEVSADGTRRPISRAKQVAVEVEVDSVSDPQRGGWVPVGTDGRYRLSGVPDNRFVKIAGVDSPGVGGPAAPYRFCGTNTVTHGDTTLDVPLFLPGAALPTPTLSGRVFTVIDGKPTPLADKVVYYASRAYGSDVWGFTDRDGRYSLCGIPRMPGSLIMLCDKFDETAYRQVVDVQGDTTIDIDATPFQMCLIQGIPVT